MTAKMEFIFYIHKNSGRKNQFIQINQKNP